MPAISTHSTSRRSALIAAIGALTLAGGPSGALASTTGQSARPAMEMPMGSSAPEHVAEALAALQKGHVSAARVDLRRAIRTKAEPMDARMHAQEALSAINLGDAAMARKHAANGAAVEHLTYALQALDTGQSDMARGHLSEARTLPKVRKYATAAITAINHGDRTAARQHIEAGLNAAIHE